MKRVLLALGAALTLTACADYYGSDYGPYYGHRYQGDYGRYGDYDGYGYRYRGPYDYGPYYAPRPYRY